MKITVCVLLVLWLVNAAAHAENFQTNPINSFDYLKMILVLAGFLAVMYGLYKLLHRAMGARGGGRYFKLIDRAPISPHAAVLLLQVGERYYVLASSPKDTVLLDTLTEAPAPLFPEPTLQFKAVLDQVRGKIRES